MGQVDDGGAAGWDTDALMAAARAAVRKEPGLRLGQALYNEAYSRNPAVAHLAGKDCDPFYVDSRIPAFLERLTARRTPGAAQEKP